ncbi:type VI secretion system accessory protein TagJ [Tabrizicola sp.]|uniref:type VI secretion system accessory protein TagJ n=1 Tax=Tabrizicola sp. TaxID=2005166 RepID=UPI003F39E410
MMHTEIAALLSEGALDTAVAAAAEAVKTKPQDAHGRIVLAELSVLAGDLERAETHAKLAARLSPGDAVGLGVFRQHLRGLHARNQWWQTGAMPTFPSGATPLDELALKLNVALFAGEGPSARAALDALDEARGPRSARWNGVPVDDLRDLDDRLPHAVEAVTAGGNYLWLDMALISEVAFQPTQRPLDLGYRRARVTLTDGAAADLLIPAVYHGSAAPEYLLGRKTDFEELPGGLTAAKGQRAFLAGEDMVGLLDAETIVFGRADDG